MISYCNNAACNAPGLRGYCHGDLCPKCCIGRIVIEPDPLRAAKKDTNPKDQAATTRVPLWLCSPIAKAHWALAQFAGMLKYGAWNWRNAGVRSSVYLSAMQRHIDAYTSGEELDPIDGSHHLGNIMACAAILLDAREANKLVDDRPPSVSLRPAYATLERLAGELINQYRDRHPRHFTIVDTRKEMLSIDEVCPPDSKESSSGDTERSQRSATRRDAIPPEPPDFDPPNGFGAPV